jgi:hypothetical protein
MSERIVVKDVDATVVKTSIVALRDQILATDGTSEKIQEVFNQNLKVSDFIKVVKCRNGSYRINSVRTSTTILV